MQNERLVHNNVHNSNNEYLLYCHITVCLQVTATLLIASQKYVILIDTPSNVER